MDSAYVVVPRCAGMPVPLMPSHVIRCGSCGADCWLSARTGKGTIARAAAAGEYSFLCDQCLEEQMASGMKGVFTATSAAINEARGAVN